MFERRVRPDEEHPTHSWRILDTFDWLLASKSLLLNWTGRELILCTVPDEEVIHSLALPNRPARIEVVDQPGSTETRTTRPCI